MALFPMVLVAALAFLLSDPLKWSPIAGVSFEPIALPTQNPDDAQQLDPQNRLRESEILFRGEVEGPETLVFDAEGRIYSGVADGRVVRYTSPGSGWETFAWTSSNRSTACGSSYLMEEYCGRPLGLKFHPKTGELYIADSYFGLMKVGPEGGLAELVVAEAEGAPFRFTNSIDISRDGIVYFTDSSTKYPRRKFMLELMEAQGHGRFMSFDPESKELKVLLSGLKFANGVALSADESFVLIVECTTSRIIKYWLKGPKAGSSESFASNLPVGPDNIHRNEKGHFWVAVHTKRTPLFDFTMARPWLKKLMLRTAVPMKYWYILSLGEPSGIVYCFDEEGNVKEILSDDGGRVVGAASDAVEHGGKLWVGSVIKNSVAVYDLNRLSGKVATEDLQAQ